MLRHVWEWFIEINAAATGGGGMGPVTISWVDLKAWADMTGEQPEPWEVRLILQLSNLQARIAADASKDPGA
jgi:hypothetical protein